MIEYRRYGLPNIGNYAFSKWNRKETLPYQTILYHWFYIGDKKNSDFFFITSQTLQLYPLYLPPDSSNQFAFFKVVRKIGIPLYIIFTLRTLKIYDRILLFFEYLNILDPLVCQNLRHFVFLASDGKEGEESITRSHHINSTLREEALRSS